MKAINLVEPGKLEMVNVPKPEPKEDEVVIRVGAVGVCGSDIRYYHGENPWSLHTLGENIEHSRSFTLGHEVSGMISETGKWTNEEKIGERWV